MHIGKNQAICALFCHIFKERCHRSNYCPILNNLSTKNDTPQSPFQQIFHLFSTSLNSVQNPGKIQLQVFNPAMHPSQPQIAW